MKTTIWSLILGLSFAIPFAHSQEQEALEELNPMAMGTPFEILKNDGQTLSIRFSNQGHDVDTLYIRVLTNGELHTDNFPVDLDIADSEGIRYGRLALPIHTSGLYTFQIYRVEPKAFSAEDEVARVEAIAEENGPQGASREDMEVTQNPEPNSDDSGSFLDRLRSKKEQITESLPGFSTSVSNILLQANTNPVWEQDVFTIQSSSFPIPRFELQKLAMKHAPIALFYSAEFYYPQSLEYIANLEDPNEELNNETFVIKNGGLRNGWEVEFQWKDVMDILPIYGHKQAVLKLSSNNKDTTALRLRGGSPETSTVYYSFNQDLEKNQLFINYHFLFSFDLKTGTPDEPALAAHPFDRESMTVVFDRTTLEPQFIVYGAHLATQEMVILDDENNVAQSWIGGRLRVEWDQAEKFEDHPFVAVARGSHALYPAPGMYQVRKGGVSVLDEIAGGDRILIPNVFSTDENAIATISRDRELDFVPYRVRDLMMDQVTSSSRNAFLAFSGYTVDVLSNSNARFPPFTQRERETSKWVNEDVVDWSKGGDSPLNNRQRSLINYYKTSLEDVISR